MRALHVRLLSLGLIPCLLADPLAASYRVVTPVPSETLSPSRSFEEQALSSLAGFFPRGLKWLNRKLTLRVTRITQDRAKRREVLRLIRTLRRMKWVDPAGIHRMWLSFRFVDLRRKTIAQMSDVALRAEEDLMKRGLLPLKHIRRLIFFIRHPKVLQGYVLPIVDRNPWTLVARRGRQVRGFVMCALGWAETADDLPATMEGMTRWHTPFGSGPINAIVDFWFTGGGNPFIAGAMLDLSMVLARLLNLKHLFAYSNPRILPKLLEEGKDISEVDCAARIIAGFLFKRLAAEAKGGRITSWEDLERHVREWAPDYMFDNFIPLIPDEIISGFRRFAVERGFAGELQANDLSRLLNLSLDRETGYVLHDPAISTHLRRGARLARIIPGAFLDISHGPGIGAGYSFVMHYDVPATWGDLEEWLRKPRRLFRRSKPTQRAVLQRAA